MQLAYAAADPWQMFQHLSSVLHGQRNSWGLREKEFERAKPRGLWINQKGCGN